MATIGALSIGTEVDSITPRLSAQTMDITVPAGTTAVVVRKLTIASGHKYTIGSGAILRII